VRDHDTPSNDQPYCKHLEQLFIRRPFLGTPDHMVGDAVVAPEHQRCDQAEHLLRFRAERAGVVRPAVQREETVDGEIALPGDDVVHPGAEGVEVVQR
jgi:hypothetical protein